MASSRSESLAVHNQKLDEFVKQSGHYYQDFLHVVKENISLQDEIKSLHISKGRLVDMNNKLENDLLKLHELIEGLQQQINTLICAEDEIRELKRILAEKELRIAIIEKELEDVKENHKENIKNLELEHNRKFSEMVSSITKERDEMVGELKNLLEEERNQNEQLQESLKKHEQKKQNEIVCLKMEFETKIKLLQRQKNQSALSKQSCDQEIFRKKLSHMKEEYEKKISELEQSVRTLEWKVSEAPILPLRERLQLFNNSNINNSLSKIKKKRTC